MRYEASPITTSCVSAIRRVRRRAKERILGFFCFMMQRYSKKAETQNFQHNYFQLCNRWEKNHYSTQKCGASPESSHSLGQMSHGLGKTRGGALYFLSLPASCQVLPREVVRYKGDSTFEDERLARICPNLERGKFIATDDMQ